MIDRESRRKEMKSLCDRMARVIDTSEVKHRRVAARFISLANRRLHQSPDIWDVMGMSFGIRDRWKNKFGAFNIEPEPIRGCST